MWCVLCFQTWDLVYKNQKEFTKGEVQLALQGVHKSFGCFISTCSILFTFKIKPHSQNQVIGD